MTKKSLIWIVGGIGLTMGLAVSARATTRWHAVAADRGHDASFSQPCLFRSIGQTPAVGCTSASSPGTYPWQIPLETIWEGPAGAVTLNASAVAWTPNITPLPANHTVQGRLITWNGALGLTCTTPLLTWAPASAPTSKSLGSCANFQPHGQFAEAEFFVGNGAATTNSRARVHSAGFTYDF